MESYQKHLFQLMPLTGALGQVPPYAHGGPATLMFGTGNLKAIVQASSLSRTVPTECIGK